MTQTYKATGINLKAMPMGEADRLLTILTREFGLIRVVAKGSRKHHSKLGGRSGLFVVNELLLVKGKSLDKIIQAESLESFPKLSQDLGKLTASQYLAELVLCQALSDQPQEELFTLLSEHLSRIERAPQETVLAHLSHAIFHLLALAGVAPQVQACCLSRQELTPDFADADWRVGFSTTAGGLVDLQAFKQLATSLMPQRKMSPAPGETSRFSGSNSVAENAGRYETIVHSQRLPSLTAQLNATQVAVLQRLAEPELLPLNIQVSDIQVSDIQVSQVTQNQASPPSCHSAQNVWISVERLLRQYVQYQFDRPIRSAALIDTCFAALPLSS